MYFGGTLRGNSPPCASALSPRVDAAASASTLSTGRRRAPSYSSGSSELRCNRPRSLRSLIIALLLVRVGCESFALVLRGGRVVGEVAWSRRTNREIVGRAGAAAEFFQKLLEHRYYLLAVLRATTASPAAAAKKRAASSHMPPITETAAPMRASTPRTDQRLPPSDQARSVALTTSPRSPLVPRSRETAGPRRGRNPPS